MSCRFWCLILVVFRKLRVIECRVGRQSLCSCKEFLSTTISKECGTLHREHLRLLLSATLEVPNNPISAENLVASKTILNIYINANAVFDLQFQ